MLIPLRVVRFPPAQAVEDCELFALQRSKFREMLALSVSASLVQRVAWMQATPELVRFRNEAGELRKNGNPTTNGTTLEETIAGNIGNVENLGRRCVAVSVGCEGRT